MAGSFVDPAVFCKLALPHLKSSASSSSSGCSSCLMILTGLLRGCNPQLVKPNLKVGTLNLLRGFVPETQLAYKNFSVGCSIKGGWGPLKKQTPKF